MYNVTQRDGFRKFIMYSWPIPLAGLSKAWFCVR